MKLSHNGDDYEIISVRENGEIVLELNTSGQSDKETLLFAYRSVADSAVFFTALQEGVAIELVEQFLIQVRSKLITMPWSS